MYHIKLLVEFDPILQADASPETCAVSDCAHCAVHRQRSSFVWGGCMVFRAEALRCDSLGIVQVLIRTTFLS